MERGTIGQEDGVLRNGNDALAEGGAVDLVEGNVVDDDGVLGGGGWKRVE